MKPQLVVLPAAEADLILAAEWYEGRAAGLGAAFLRAVEVCFALVHRNPEAYQQVAPTIRRARLRRFPFSAYYLTSTGRIVIIAVLHVRRDPREWKQRLDA